MIWWSIWATGLTMLVVSVVVCWLAWRVEQLERRQRVLERSVVALGATLGKLIDDVLRHQRSDHH